MNATALHAVLGMTLLVASAPGASAAESPIKIIETKEALQINIEGKPFTTYHFTAPADDPEWHRPYFFPVLSAEGVPLTSDRARETIGQATREHPWHRSVWIGQGDVNGIDHWTHPKTGKKLQRHLKFSKLDADSFVQELAWDGREEGKPVLSETRTVKFLAYPDGARAIDVTSLLKAGLDDVTFKVKPLNVSGVEGGWLAVRVAGDISSNKASVITAAGSIGEKEARSNPSGWCDYSGPIGGKIFGVAEFDDPANPGHPTPFHVRVGGLMTHLGVHNWTLKAGESQRFRHGLFFHPGDAKAARVEERYSEFTAPPPSP